MDDFVSRAEYDADLKRIEAEDSRQNRRIDKLEDTVTKIGDLAISVRELAVNVSSMQESIRTMTERLSDIEEEPAENWKKAVWIVIAAIIGAAIGAALRSIGL